MGLTRAGPKPTLRSFESSLGIAAVDHRAAIANTFVMWYMFLGGYVEEETFWSADKPYVWVSPSFPPLAQYLHASDSLKSILNWHLSTRLMEGIPGRQDLKHLIGILAAWKELRIYLTQMACQRCCVTPDAAARVRLDVAPNRKAERFFLIALRRLRPPLTAIHGKFLSRPPQADPRCLPTCKLNHTSLSSSHRGELSEAKVDLPPHTHFVLIARPAYPKQKQSSQLAELDICCSQQSSHHLFLCFELHCVSARHPEPRARDRGHETQRA